MTTQTQESLGLEIYKQILDCYTIHRTAQTLGLSENEFMKMLSSDRVDELEALVNRSFKNYWGQMIESDRHEFIEENREFLDE